jgi:hypothetical protein
VTGTEAIAVTAASPDGTDFVVGRTDILQAISGTKVITLAATAGFAAGQKILLTDATLPGKLTSDLVTGTTFTIENSRQFAVGDSIHLHDDNTADEDATILTVDHETNTIVLTAACAGTFTMAQNAFAQLQTGKTSGWAEMLTIASLVLNTSLTVVETIENTYSAEADVQRLIQSYVPTLSAGTPGDCVEIIAAPDRPLDPTLNSSSSSSSSRSFSSSSSSSFSSSSFSSSSSSFSSSSSSRSSSSSSFSSSSRSSSSSSTSA